MKTLKNLLFFAVISMIAALTFTSCLNSDDDDNSSQYHAYTAAEKAVVMNAFAGNYTGRIKYYKDNNYTTIDSTAITFTAYADSNFVMPNFPVSILANYLNTTDEKSVLTSVSGVNFNATAHLPIYVYNSYFENGYYEYSLIPNNSLSFTSNGKSVIITFASYLSSTTTSGQYYYPMCSYYKNQVGGYILIENISIDGVKTAVNKPLVFSGTK
jgi:hypothetical protein